MTCSFYRSPVCQTLLVGCFFAGAGAVQANACGQVSALENFAESNITPAGAACTTYLTQSAGAGVSCHWTFPFRDDAALTFADAAWSDLKSCRKGHEAGADALVNHPDSYDLRALAAGDATYSVSIKDKGGLQKTLVFMKYDQHRN